jgi:hypothetical protein
MPGPEGVCQLPACTAIYWAEEEREKKERVNTISVPE